MVEITMDLGDQAAEAGRQRMVTERAARGWTFRALELPGCGGRIAAHQVLSHDNLAFHAHFTFVADTDAERVAIGLAAAELRANPPTILTSAELLAARPGFDHVFGSSTYERPAGLPSARALVESLGCDARWA